LPMHPEQTAMRTAMAWRKHAEAARMGGAA
jgi:hypothetical protein